MKLNEIKRGGMYIVTYHEKGFGHITIITKMCTKKQFLKELTGKDSKEITRICKEAVFYAL